MNSYWENLVICFVLCSLNRTFAAMLLKTEALVLHSLKYGEGRLIVTLFTREAGRLSCMVNVPKTSRGRLKKQYFQPLSLLNVEVDVRPRVQLQRLRHAAIGVVYGSLAFERGKLAVGLFLAEFLYRALRGEQQPDERLFDYIRHSLEWLDQRPSGYANFHLVFLMHLSRFLGFYPNLDIPSQTRGPLFFDLREGGFTEQPPLHQDFLEADESVRIMTMMRMDYKNMHLFRMNRNDRVRCLEVVLRYYRLHLPAFPELKSLSVLQEVFSADQ